MIYAILEKYHDVCIHINMPTHLNFLKIYELAIRILNDAKPDCFLETLMRCQTKVCNGIST